MPKKKNQKNKEKIEYTSSTDGIDVNKIPKPDIKIKKDSKVFEDDKKETINKTNDLDIDLSNIDINSMLDGEDSGNSSSMKVGEVVSNISALDRAADIDSLSTTESLVRYAFANNEDKPILLEKLLSDGDARIKEISTINALQSQLNITKLAALEQTVLNDIIYKVNNISFLSLQDELSIFTTINTAKEKAQKQIFDYIKMSRDFSSMPTIYRQLVDKLMIMPDDKVTRLKTIPELMELPDELWNRIIEIVEIYNKR
ncbi:MAG: hypothetical protein IJF92_00670 [Bacilli bacterium]|nr:hypothetical protein [Bacilli bacterium]MBQ3307673.1 hypothetical protein [Bacilli bacterium]